MIRRLGFGFLFALIGYAATALSGYFLIMAFSSNMNDRQLEALMTAFFFFGPVGALLGFAGGMVFGGRKFARRS